MSLYFLLSLTMGLMAPATDHIAEGEAAWQDERWEDASAAFARAWETTGDPTFLYTRAQAERRAGHCDVAIELYEEFIARDSSAKAKALAQEYIDACQAELPDPAAPAPAPVPTVDDPTANPGPTRESAPNPDAPARPTPKWYLDPWGDGLAAAGVLTIATGGALVGVAYRNADRANDASDDRAFGQALQSAQRLERGGAVALGLGGALLLAGVIRWAVVGGSSRRQGRVSGLIAPGAAVVHIQLPSLHHRH